MPIYNFNCKNCGLPHEVFQNMSDQRPVDCPECKGKNCLVRDYSGISVIEDSQKPKTLGALADQNTERMVKEGKLDKKVLEWESRKEEKKQKLSKIEEVANMTPTQKRNYIMTGRKNG